MSSNSCSSNCAIANNCCHTDLRVDKVNYTWTINHIDFYLKKRDRLNSSTFSSATNDAFKWFLQLRFNEGENDGDTNYETDEKRIPISVYLFLNRYSKRKRVFAKYSFTAFGDQRRKIKSKPFCIDEFNTARTNDCWGYANFMKNDYEFQSNVTEGKLTIVCDIEFSEMNNVSKSFHQCNPQVSGCNLSEDLESSMKNPEFADVTLSVNGKNYPAHKFILAARSPVFAAMFRHEMMESQQSIVTIDDVKEEVMDEILKYIYTGKCENVDELGNELLEAADKYALDRLKIICGEMLLKTLTIDNASDVLVLADRRGMNDLKCEVIKFVVPKFTDVLNTDAWKRFLSSNSELVNEVCQAVVRR
ncbi:protein roadkill-like isoform X5 [Planococcus citri]|uniref:protein roadkill-like isoform X5 n=1 Tax=Planococcus citri TaxID=170843 RepID=UPI0031F87CCA